MPDIRVHASESLRQGFFPDCTSLGELNLQAIGTWGNGSVTRVEIHRTSMQLADIPDSTGPVYAGQDWSIIMPVSFFRDSTVTQQNLRR